MNNNVKAAIIVAVGLVLAAWAFQFFSAENTCMREAGGPNPLCLRGRLSSN